MSVPPDLPDIGSTGQRLRQNPGFDPLAAGIGPEEYFVWTRFDGATTLRDLIVMTGFSTPRAVDIVRKLRAVGAILLPGEQPPPVKDDVDLDPAERARITAMHARVGGGDPLVVLGVTDRDDKKAIKRAYFQLSKEFHPDRFYGKRTGRFAPLLDEIFQVIAAAYAELTGERAHGRRPSTPAPHRAETGPFDAARELFEHACHAEMAGDFHGALQLFAQALRVESSPRFYRRAARCALAADERQLALDYAKKAANLEPNDPSTARLLAQAFKASGKLDDAEETLVLALMIKTGNDQLAHELQADLAEVRRLSSR